MFCCVLVWMQLIRTTNGCLTHWFPHGQPARLVWVPHKKNKPPGPKPAVNHWLLYVHIDCKYLIIYWYICTLANRWYIYIHVCILSISIYLSIYLTSYLSIYLSIYIYIYVYTYMYIYIYISISFKKKCPMDISQTIPNLYLLAI